MPVTPDTPAPYAPPSAILEMVERHRSRGLPSVVDDDVLGRSGVSQSLIPRTLAALQSLDLIDETGAITPTLEAIRLAPETEYKQRLADWLTHAYADALTFVDPATATEGQVRDAFRNYKPIGQQSRMVTLFMGLWAAAGVGPEKKPSPPRKSTTAVAPPKRAQTQAKPVTKATMQPVNLVPGIGQMPPALAGLMASLPAAGRGWPNKEMRNRFVSTFSAVLDFCFPVEAEADRSPEAAEDET